MRTILLIALIALLPGLANAVPPASFSGQDNPCVEGDFLDIGENQCKTLDTSFGFDWDTFNSGHLPATVVTITTANCNNATLASAFSTINSAGGGTINIEACTLVITGSHTVPSNLLLQGAGSALTIFTNSAGFTANELLACDSGDNCQNIVVRDIRVNANSAAGSKPTIALNIQWVKNLLYERINMQAVNKTAINTKHSQGVTARYLYIKNAASGSLGAKDCFAPSTGSAGSWSMSNCGSGDFWSSDQLWMSNFVENSAATGNDSHISDFESAGNYFLNSSQAGAKLPEISRRVWVHDNWSRNSAIQGITSRTQSCSRTNADMQSSNHVLYRNRIENNGSHGYVALYTTNVYLKDNIMTGNANGNQWSTSSSCPDPTDLANTTAFLCPGGDMTTSNETGAGSATNLAANNSKCDLSNVATIF